MTNSVVDYKSFEAMLYIGRNEKNKPRRGGRLEMEDQKQPPVLPRDASEDSTNTQLLDELVEERYLLDNMVELSENLPSLTFDSVALDFPYRGSIETLALPPNGTVTWYANGRPGSLVTIENRFIASNGHNHSNGTTDPRVVGRCSPSRFTLPGEYPQNYPVVFRATAFCGRINLVATFSTGHVDSNNFVDVRFPGLISLPPHPNIRPYQNDSTHPQSHYGRRDLVLAILNVATAFGAQFPGRKLWVNDMSLPWGGVFDVGGTHAGPHNGHMWGGEVDISYNLQTSAEREWFRLNAEGAGKFTRVILHGNPLHWHCSIF